MRRRFIQNKKESLWTPFYIEALEDGVSFSIDDKVEYKIDDGDWISLGSNINSESINKGSRLYIKGEITSGTLYEEIFSIHGLCKIGGDIKSLSFREQAKKINKINDNQFQFLFKNCTTIKEVLIDFHLITTLGQYCFHGMFSGCTSLVKVHNLPAATLKLGCYMSMFSGCTNLNYIKMLSTEAKDYNGNPIAIRECLNSWVSNVSPTGTFVKSKYATWDTTPGALGYSGVPDGWAVITEEEESNPLNVILNINANNGEEGVRVYNYISEKIPWRSSAFDNLFIEGLYEGSMLSAKVISAGSIRGTLVLYYEGQGNYDMCSLSPDGYLELVFND